MEIMIISIIIWIIVVIISLAYCKNIDNYSDKLNLFSLLIMALVSMLAYDRINNHDIKILYSLGLVIASGVGRYGTELSTRKKTVGFKPEFSGIRQIIYLILFISGLVGLLN